MKNFIIFLILGGLCFLGCAGEQRVPRPRRALDNPAQTVSITPFLGSPEAAVEKPADQEKVFGVEVTWALSSEPVDEYIIFTGNSPEKLNTEIRLIPAEIEIEQASRYRYVISPVDSSKPLWVAVGAKRGDEVAKTEALQIKPSEIQPSLDELRPRFILP